MCAIFGSFDKDTLLELYNKNKYRGKFSFSITSLDTKTFDSNTHKYFGEMEQSHLDEHFVEGRYHICHSQAPTGSLMKDESRIHPVELNEYKLLHNGIIVNECNDELKVKYNTDSYFDTYNLARAIHNDGYSVLDDIQGSFACAEIAPNGLNLFRNANSVICTNGFDISSTKLKDFVAIEPNIIYNIDFKDGIVEVDTFNNNYSNFYIV